MAKGWRSEQVRLININQLRRKFFTNCISAQQRRKKCTAAAIDHAHVSFGYPQRFPASHERTERDHDRCLDQTAQREQRDRYLRTHRPLRTGHYLW